MKRFILAIILSLFLVVPVFGADVTLGWEENTEYYLGGYQILQTDTPGGPYTLIEEIPPNYHEADPTLPDNFGRDSYRVTDLSDGIYYWVLTAFSNKIPRIVSGYSSEVGVNVVDDVPFLIPPKAPTGLTASQDEEE